MSCQALSIPTYTSTRPSWVLSRRTTILKGSVSQPPSAGSPPSSTSRPRPRELRSSRTWIGKPRKPRTSYIDWSVSGILLDAGPTTLEELPKLVSGGLSDLQVLHHLQALRPAHGRREHALAPRGDARDRRHAHGPLRERHDHRAAACAWSSRPGIARPSTTLVRVRRLAEVVAIRRVIDLMREVPAPVYIVHVSTCGGARADRERQARGPAHPLRDLHALSRAHRGAARGPAGAAVHLQPPLEGGKAGHRGPLAGSLLGQRRDRVLRRRGCRSGGQLSHRRWRLRQGAERHVRE